MTTENQRTYNQSPSGLGTMTKSLTTEEKVWLSKILDFEYTIQDIFLKGEILEKKRAMITSIWTKLELFGTGVKPIEEEEET